MGWFDTNPKNMINARIAYDGAGAIGRGITGVGSAVSGYAKLKYQKKRDNQEENIKKYEVDGRIKTHNIDYRKEIDSKNIEGKTKKYEVDGRIKTHNIDYRKEIDSKNIEGKTKKYEVDGRIKTHNIDSHAKLKSSSISAGVQRYVSDNNVKSARIKKRKTSTPKLNLKSVDDVEALLKKRNTSKRKVGDEEL